MSIVDCKTVLITGGTGSFGTGFVSTVLRSMTFKKVIVLRRYERKQWEMRQWLSGEDRVRCFMPDARDHQRLLRAFAGGHFGRRANRDLEPGTPLEWRLVAGDDQGRTAPGAA